MDLRQHRLYIEVLEDIQTICKDILQAPRTGKYRLYRELSAYVLEDIDTQKTILFRSSFKDLIKSAKERGLDMREVIIDL
tara:strand:+ start:174 stop:413 length:240 start_codon:yes stop_codon:yes gene_type:complete